ncbi:GNAT family N-acetyltransferase [Putridiphycobacter roseus]|uniref:GNAT family N-acetyltransferase n=1 Tax=Putridiphycobacter roseus TaxID=2219161 RepID=A0A2W1MUE1_9FLAO|nr:GNAT family N-acetyltransferase [Putridiphycobacter roseus]PZE15679.1 GNAT family N-acetyltransferase [Putridiphycobacter roseus]
MDFIFKRVEIKDKNIVLNLFKETAEKINKLNVDHWQYWKNPAQEQINWVMDGIQNKEFFFIYDLQEEEWFGMVRILKEDLMYWGKQDEKAIYVHSLVVKEKYNGKGIGIKILAKIASNAKNDHCKYLRLDADSKNPKLCSYYEKIGFKKVGVKALSLSAFNLYEKAL